MKSEDIRIGERIRVNLPGVGDHGHIGTVRKVRGSTCSVHMDWDQRPGHVVVFFSGDLDLVTNNHLEDAAEPKNVL